MNILRREVYVVLACLTGALAFTISGLWFLAPVSLALLFASLFEAETRNVAVIRGLVFGIVTGGASIWWAWGALPFLWLGYTSPWEGAYVMAIIWGLVSIGLGVAVGVYGGVVWHLRKVPYWSIVVVPLWLVAEWGRMWSFSLLAVGENSLLGPHFSFASFGYLLADLPVLLSAAERGGVYALSLLVALTGAALYTALRGQRYAALALIVTAALVTVPSTHVTALEEPLPIAIAHTLRHTLPTLPLSFSEVLHKAGGASIVVVPEDLFMFGTTTLEDSLRTAKQTAPQALVAFPHREQGAQGLYRNAVVLATDGVELARFQKQFLMPEGEYLPFLSQFIFTFIGDQRVTGYFSSTKQLFQGAPVSSVLFESLEVRGLMCSDIISPKVAQMQHVSDAKLFINIGDQSWFNGSALLHRRLVQMAQVRAVENRAFVVVANRSSPSYVINPRGEIVAESVWDTEGVLYAALK